MTVRVVLGTWGRLLPRDDDAIRVDFSNATISRGEATIHLQPMQFVFAAIVLARAGQFITYTDLIDGLYGDRADGGPLRPMLIIRQHMHYVRPQLARLGISLRACWGRGAEVRFGHLPSRLTPPSPSVFRVAA